MSDDPKVSNPTDEAQKGADAAEPTGATSEANSETGADAAGEDEVTRLRRELLEAKIRAEEKNRLIESLSRQPQGQSHPTPPAGADPTAQAMQEALFNLQLRAQNGDQDALLQLGMLQRQQAQEKFMYDQRLLANTPREDQELVWKLYSENRQRFGDPEVAARWLQAERLQSRASELDQAQERLKAAEANKRAGVTVSTRPVAAPEAARVRMTHEEFESKYAELQAQGKTQEAWALSKRAATGELWQP